MNFKKTVITFIGLLAAAVIISGCGDGVKKKDLGPDAYFEYAKAKFDKGNYLEAQTDFTIIVLKFSGNPVIDDAQYYLAESHFKQKEYIIAISEYQKLINDYSTSQYIQLAQFKIAMAYEKQSLRPALDQDYTNKAIRQFQEFVDENPDHGLRSEAEKSIARLRLKLARKQLSNANTYRKMGVYESAVIYYDLILTKYYDTPVAENAMFWKGESQYKQKKYLDAQTTLTVFVEKYPQSKYSDRAKSNISKLAELIKESGEDSSIDNQAGLDGGGN